MASGDRIYVADKETLDKIYNILAPEQVYGFIEHNAVLAPASRIEYIGANKDYNPITVTMGGGFSLGDWADFPVLANNKPWMVKSSGLPDYQLLETDYTKKASDGTTASDVANTSYDGGAFSWIQKIYKKEWMVGDDRYVLFSPTKKEGFEAVGFIDSDDNELEGVWIPMFYGAVVDSKMVSFSGTTPSHTITTAAQKTAIDTFSSRGKFFGGAIINTIIDLLLMLAKTSELQTFYGCGNMSGYDASDTTTYGKLDNAVVSGGQFYGTSDTKSLNKILHSVVLGAYNQWQRDPYTLCVSGELKVSKNYTYDLTGAAYQDTGIDYSAVGDTNWRYPHKYITGPGFGAVPSNPPYSGSSSTGGCDGFVVNTSTTAVSRRFGRCGTGRFAGLRALALDYGAGGGDWSVGASVLLLPPVGVSP